MLQLTTESMKMPDAVPRKAGGNTSATAAWPVVRKAHSAQRKRADKDTALSQKALCVDGRVTALCKDCLVRK